MPAIVFDDWAGGLDLRQSPPVGAANTLLVGTNCYITTGKKIRKRPCLTPFAGLEPGTVGLKSLRGKLHTFYGQGTLSHVNPFFVANKVAHPTVPQDVTRVHYAANFNGFTYASVEYTDGSIKHHYLDGTPATHITDVNCPNSAVVRKLRQKIYAGSGGNVRFCKTSFPRDWTAASDAGFIPSETEAEGADEVTALGDFRGDLSIYFADSLQLWDVDADPSLNLLKDTAANVGTLYGEAVSTFANDEVFLAGSGFRSLALAVLTDNLEETDIGSPIDDLRGEVAATDRPFMVYYPRLSQLWTVNGTRAYVITYSKKAKITAWSIYDFPIPIEAMAVLSTELYARSGNRVYRVDRNVFTDDGVVPLVTVEMSFQDAKTPGVLKQFIGFDGVIKGSPSIAFGYDPREPSLVTPYFPLSGSPPPLIVGARYLDLPGTAGNYASTPDSPALRITGDIEFEVQLKMDDWTPATDFNNPIGKWDGSGGAGTSYYMAVRSTGHLHIQWIDSAGTSLGVTSTAPTGIADGETMWLRLRLDVDNDNGGNDATFEMSPDRVTYTPVGAVVTTAGVTSIISRPGAASVGARDHGTAGLFPGRIYRAIVRNGIDGARAVDFDPARISRNTFKGVMDTEEEWTVHRSGSPAAAIGFATAPVTEAHQTIRVDTRPGDLLPMELQATSIAPKFIHQADELFQVDQLMCHYENLAAV